MTPLEGSQSRLESVALYEAETSMRRTIRPGIDAVAWAGGQWGPRRVRAEECAYTLRAENVYTLLIRDVASLSPGMSGQVIAGGNCVRWETRRNHLWRFGRVFLGCPRCSRRVTSLYMPRVQSAFACRQCWGLSYRSRQNSYRRTGWSAIFGTLGASQTRFAREERQEAGRRRRKERREVLRGARPSA